MIQTAPSEAAKLLVNWLSEATNGLELPSTQRIRLAAGCLFVALEHHSSIVLLFDKGFSISAMALIRPLFESYVRGAWLAHCADELRLADFTKGNDLPSTKIMIEKLEDSYLSETNVLSTVRTKNFRAMCGYTHTGIQQVLLVSKADSIERNCPPELAEEALCQSGAIAILASIALAGLAKDDQLALKLLEKAKAFSKSAKAELPSSLP